MKCTELSEQIESFLDGEINPTMKSRIEFHLWECQFCQLNLRKMQAVKRALRASLPASPGRQFDEQMMKAFHERQKQTSNNKFSGWYNVLISLFMPRVGWAFAAAVFVIGVLVAFQIGKLCATDIQASLRPLESVNLPSPEIKEEKLPFTTITKIIEVPVIREKIITRVVYLKRDKQNGIQAKRINAKLPGNIAINSSIAKNNYRTQINLKGFQPVSEITAAVIKEKKNDEK
jgi:hypothetical protein